MSLCPDDMKNPTAGIKLWLSHLLNSASQWLLPLLALRPLLSHKEDTHRMTSKVVRESGWVTCLIMKAWKDVEVGGTYCVAGELPEHLYLR